MSIVAADLVPYSAASIPEDDASTSGGAIDTATKPTLTQFSSSAVCAVVSDGADTRTVTITGRDAGGAIVSEVLTLNGTSEVVGAQTFERILKAVLSTTSGSRTVLLKQGSGGTTRGTFGVNITKLHIFFQRSGSAGTSKVRYEKMFWKNTNGSLTLTSSQMTLTADAAAKIQIGCDTAIDATVSVANRLTAPTSVTYVDDNVAQNVPNSQNLPSGSAIGVWIQQTLASNDSPQKSTFTTQLSGNTT